MAKKIDWNKIASKNFIQKKAVREAIELAGNCNQLALIGDVSRSAISQILYRECFKGKDLVKPALAAKWEKRLKIKGLTERLCPSQKK